MAEKPYASPRESSAQVAEIIRPNKRIRPSQAVEQWLRTEKGPWRREQSPMMVEPLDQLASRQYQGIIFVGPSRSGKTFTLVIGGITYVVTCAPADTQVTHQNKVEGGKWSKTDLSRAIEESSELAKRLSPRPRDDNVYDKFFKSGMMLQLAWPTASQHSAKTLKYVFLTDYDQARNHQNVDERGTLWNLAFPRIRTYMSRGKCVAESSPGDDLLDPLWRQKSPHEAPPVTGILELYNLGTRARYYWQCQHCHEYFEATPGVDIFRLPTFEELEVEVMKRDLMWLAEQYAKVGCPHCGGMHEKDQKYELNLGGRWVHAGEAIDAKGIITGERRRTNIVSYWQGGATAAFQQWDSLLFRYFQAIQSYVKSGSDEQLKSVTNTDLAMPYLPRSVAKKRGAEELMARVENWPEGTVPKQVRFLTACADTQANRFEIRVVGWGIGLESWLIARYAITSSVRQEGDRTAALDPAGFTEDWDVLIPELVHKTYPMQDNPDVRMPIHFAMVDSGGKDGVTTRAYDFWRSLRKKNLHKRLMLLKGDKRMNMPQTQLTWPDAKDRKDRKAGGRGDVPVWLINVNIVKDTVANDLARDAVGPGYHHIPDWIPDEYFDQIVAETRTEKGWVKPQGVKNEDWDLHVYNRACCVILRAHAINWESPPPWARGMEGLPRVSQQQTKVQQPTAQPTHRRGTRSGGVQI